jgi:flagellar biosynthetic protein FliS
MHAISPKRAYQEAAVGGANPMRLTVMLYEQIMQDVARADQALHDHRPDLCAQEIGHAVAVIGYLQSTLRPEAGADVVRNLARFYTMLREKLMEGQVRSSHSILEQLRQQLLEVHGAWAKVEAETVAMVQ